MKKTMLVVLALLLLGLPFYISGELDANAYRTRGMMQALAGDREQALENLDQAIKLDPNHASTYDTRGLLHAVEGDYDRAIADFDQSIKLDPKQATVFHNRGMAHVSKGNFEQGRKDFEHVLKLDPNHPSAKDFLGKLPRPEAIEHFKRGLAYDKAEGDHGHDRAIAAFGKAIEISPDYASAYRYRGLRYALKDDHDRAMADYDQAIKINPNYATAYRYRGLSHTAQNNHDRAIADFDQAIKINPNYTAAYYARGLAYTVQKNGEQARADFERVLKLDPSHADAREMLSKISPQHGSTAQSSTGHMGSSGNQGYKIKLTGGPALLAILIIGIVFCIIIANLFSYIKKKLAEEDEEF